MWRGGFLSSTLGFEGLVIWQPEGNMLGTVMRCLLPMISIYVLSPFSENSATTI